MLSYLVGSCLIHNIELGRHLLHSLLCGSVVSHLRIWELIKLVLRTEVLEILVEVWMLLFLPDERVHFPLLPLDDLGHGLVEEVPCGVHASLTIFLAERSVSSRTIRYGSRLVADSGALEVRNPLIWALVGVTGHVWRHLDLEGSSSGYSSGIRVLDPRILNYIVILHLLWHRIGFVHRDRTIVREIGESWILMVEVVVELIGGVVR